MYYSYLRYSSGKQQFGRSEQRQIELADAWARRHGVTFEKPMADRGLSGYHGQHRSRGELGAFLADVESGVVPKGSTLIIESIDRLGREGPMDTLRHVIGKLWDHDITLQLLNPEITCDKTAQNDWRFQFLTADIQRAHGESKRKSDLVRDARNDARKEVRERKRAMFTANAPAWLRAENGELVAIPEAAATIQRLFQMYARGVGKPSIANTLNADPAAWQPPRKHKNQKGKGWRDSYVYRVLVNPAVIGVFQPMTRTAKGRVPVGDPVENYFPVIVKPALFHAVQTRMAGNKRTGGPVNYGKNLFRGLARCPYCGGSMSLRHIYQSERRYLRCDNGVRRVKCGRHSIRYQEVENLILDMCPELRPEQCLPKASEQTERIRLLCETIASKKAELADAERRLGNLTDQIADMDDGAMRQRLVAKAEGLQASKPQLQADIKTAEQELAKASAGEQELKAWQRDLKTLKAKLDDVDVRHRVQAHLREIIDRIDVYASGRPSPMKLRGVPKEYHAFLADVAERQATKAGRFVVVTFKSGCSVTLAPLDSVALFEPPVKGFDGGWSFAFRRQQEAWRAWLAE